MSQTTRQAKTQPPLVTAVLGLEHVLAMVVGAIALPLILGRALGMAPGQIGGLVNAGLLACGLATIIQSLRVTPHLGAGVPARAGLAFAALGPLLVMATQPGLGDAASRLQVMLGATIAAGVVGVLAASALPWLRPLFPAVVRGTVMLVVGIVLLRAGAGWIAAAPAAGETDIGAPARLGLAAAVLVAIALIARYGGALPGRLATVIGLTAGALVAWSAGAMSFGNVEAAQWFGLVRPLQFGPPRFEPVSVLALSIVTIVVAMETDALLARVRRTTSRAADPVQAEGGVRADGVASLLAGVLGSFPCSTWEAAANRPGPAGANARHAAAFAGVVVLLIGLCPKAGALAVAVPQAVLGGAGLVVFGLVAAHGVRMLADVDYVANRFNLYVVAIALGMGLVPMVAPQFFKVVLAATPSLSSLLHSSVVLAAIAAVVLNLCFNGRGARGPAAAAARA